MQGTRRDIITTLMALPPATLLARDAALAQGTGAPPTPQCRGDDDPTPAQIAGPYYKPDAPLRRDLRTGAGRGEAMDLSGHVFDTHCRPLRGAIVEIWHADSRGVYDNRGFRLRGHQVTDAEGRWAFETLVAPQYSFRTAHYHFRVHHPGARALITQIYFPGHPRNATDRMFDTRLLMRASETAQHRAGTFDFVLATV